MRSLKEAVNSWEGLRKLNAILASLMTFLIGNARTGWLWDKIIWGIKDPFNIQRHIMATWRKFPPPLLVQEQTSRRKSSCTVYNGCETPVRLPASARWEVLSPKPTFYVLGPNEHWNILEKTSWFKRIAEKEKLQRVHSVCFPRQSTVDGWAVLDQCKHPNTTRMKDKCLTKHGLTF